MPRKKEIIMDEKRKGELAYLCLKLLVKEKGIRNVSPDAKREIANEAKKHGIEPTEALEFVKILNYEVLEEAFGEK
jgi:hypothetical protein